MKHLFKILSLATVFIGSCNVPGQDVLSLEESFLNPPESAKPWVYWYWISDNITKDGITRDLEAMAEAGIGEALIGNVVNDSTPFGEMKILSGEWWDCVVHAISEAGRLGIKIGMFNCPGWSQSGGPWITPEKSMRYLVSSQTRITGGQTVDILLESPQEQFQQVAVQAFRADSEPSRDARELLAGIVVGQGTISEVEKAFDGDRATSMTIYSLPAEIEVRLREPIPAQSLQIFPAELPMSAQVELLAEKDGMWHKVMRRKIDRYNILSKTGPMVFGPVAESFPEVCSDKFLIRFTDSLEVTSGNPPAHGKVCEIELGERPVLSHFVEKQLGRMSPRPDIDWYEYEWAVPTEPSSDRFVIGKGEVIDLTGKVDAGGRLRWDAPEGEWVVLRTGMTSTGITNHPASPEGKGLEVDKMNREYARFHFDSYIGVLLDKLTPEQRKHLRHVVADSFETGSQNWTENMREDFINAYGYDPVPWLPVLTGRIISSADESDRFLWDMRRLVADRVASEYVGGLSGICEENGLKLWLENYGHWGFPGEFLNYGSRAHHLGGEFWLTPAQRGAVECRAAVSASHIYGKNVISAEAFTNHGAYQLTPRDLKRKGDWSWAEGINHFVLHVYIHQPYEEHNPGVNAWFGIDFNRKTTWFAEAKSYFDYIRRSCALLQQGVNVADAAYFIGDDTPKMAGVRDPELPRGYGYDYINGEVLMTRAKVKDNELVLESGARYKVLVLPPQTTMRPELLEKIGDFIKEGLTVVGPRPSRSPSMAGYPECDERVKKLSERIWGDADGVGVHENIYGKGRVFTGADMDDVFSRIGVREDITIPEGYLYTHRKAAGADIYFISNQLDAPRRDEFSFRVAGKQPELWNAVDGTMRNLPEFTQVNGRTSIPLEFGSGDSWFIVFRNKVGGEAAGSNFPQKKNLMTLEGPWEVAFDENYGAPAQVVFDKPEEWTQNADPAIKYYGGSATYSKIFHFEADMNKEYFINLGRVESLATVTLNGREVAGLWRYPYRADISNYLTRGENTLNVKVTNAWWNRLVGDMQPGAKRYTWTTFRNWKADSPLLPSGLIGPVTIETNVP